MKKKVEILAPAGSFECLIAALKSGADAIYVGGDRFGARANANNFTLEELKQAIDLVHLHGKQLYLTVNTLLKEKELREELYDYLLPLYVHGIDAVIVQDLGVLTYIREQFPKLAIHASTQMTVTNLLGAKFLEEQGVERVVTSRELSIEEVSEISHNTELEIESFVHGALCYSFSGQCLYSSMIGGRSGNRGQCAQPCRLPYKVQDKNDYFMSLKDICTLHEIPALIEAGVFSFKIEGRMKKPEYVASVTSMYRKYVDLYLANGKKNYRVLEEDMDLLRDIFNRGDFHGGYWKQHNGPEMITNGKPSHTGVPVVEIKNIKGRTTYGKVLKALHRGDILDISEKGDNYTLGRDYSVGEMIELSLRKGVCLQGGTLLYRTRNQWLIDSIYEGLDKNKFQESVEATLVLMVGAPAMLNLRLQEMYVSVEGELVQKAEKAPAKKEKILQQMNKTGNTPFCFDKIDLIMDEDIFLPVQQLNQLRREGLEQLEKEVANRHRRVLPTEKIGNICKNIKDMNAEDDLQRQYLTVYIETQEQFNIIIEENIFSKIYVDCNAMPTIWDNPLLIEWVAKAHQNHQKIYLVMPHIFRYETVEIFDEFVQELFSVKLDGFMVRNLEAYEFLKLHNYQGEILLDHHVYMYNNWAIKFWGDAGVNQMTHALELTAKEMTELQQEEMELVVYGYTPNMISAQCIRKTTGKCTKKLEIIKIKDRINKEIYVKNCCDYCYNIVYNTCPTCLFDESEEIQNIGPRSCRISFTVESETEVRQVLRSVKDFYYNKCNTLTQIETTKGHFRRGVK